HIVPEEKCTLSEIEIINEIHSNCVSKLADDCIPHGYKICKTFPVKNNGKRDMELIKKDRENFVFIKDGKLTNMSFN
ncbi:MAG: hypothetical protein IKB93_00475, partial [Clostridia bacterium]|nr:hypothetical protein [Clostridia bacterium]